MYHEQLCKVTLCLGSAGRVRLCNELPDDLRKLSIKDTAFKWRLKFGFHMICNGRRRSAISIGNQSASFPRQLQTLSVRVCDTRSEWSEKLNLILLSRPLRPRRQRTILMGTRVWTVCDNRRHIVPLKSRVSNCPVRTKNCHSFWTRHIKTCAWDYLIWDRQQIWEYLYGVCDSSIADGRRPLQIIWNQALERCYPIN